MGCPRKGCQAAAFATGRFLKWLESQIKERHAELLLVSADLSAEQRDSLMEDWDRAQALIHYELSLKLGFWKTLPYVVFGLGDDDEDEARAACAQSVTMYDMLLDSDERDWFTEFMLSPKSDMGQQLREFASGEKALMELPLLQEERVIAQCVPITEESIEGKHAIVNRGIRHAGHVSPAYVSATVLRGREIEDRIVADPSFLHTLARNMGSSWPMTMAARLGILQHPALQQSLSDGTHIHQNKACVTHREVAEVVYRCDLDSQFAENSALDKTIDQRRKVIEKANKSDIKHSIQDMGEVERIRFLIASEHLLTQLAPMSMFTYIGPADHAVQVEDRICHQRGTSSSANCAMTFTDDAGGFSDAIVPMEGAGFTPRFYRALDLAPNRRKRVKLGSDAGGFKPWDFVVEEHAVQHIEGGKLPAYNAPVLPTTVSRFQAARVLGLKEAANLPQSSFRDCITAWQMSSRVLGFECEEGFEYGQDWGSLSNVGFRLMDAGAVPDAKSGLVVGLSDDGAESGADMLPTLTFLKDNGLVEQICDMAEASEWKLTTKGLQKLRGTMQLIQLSRLLRHDPTQPRHTYSTYALWDYLHEHKCEPLAIDGGRGLKARIEALPSFEIGLDQKMFMHKKVSKMYLLCLALALDNHDADEEPLCIRHLQSDKYYSQVITGIDSQTAKYVLEDLARAGDMFIEEGGFAVDDEEARRPRKKKQSGTKQRQAISGPIALAIDNGEDDFHPDPADDAEPPKQKRRLHGKQRTCAMKPNRPPEIVGILPGNIPVVVVQPSVDVTEVQPPDDVADVHSPDEEAVVHPPAAVTTAVGSAAAPPSWHKDLHPDDLELVGVADEDTEDDMPELASADEEDDDEAAHDRGKQAPRTIEVRTEKRPKGACDRPDLGQGFHDLGKGGISYDCMRCGACKHLSTKTLGEDVAVQRLLRWRAVCKGHRYTLWHQAQGKPLLADFATRVRR